MLFFALDTCYISLQQLTEKLGYSDTNATQKYLKTLNVKTFKIGRESHVFKWDLDLAIHLQSAISLRERYPTKWKEVFIGLTNDKFLSDAVILLMTDNNSKGNQRMFI